jgi:SAM-dependent methyltransferase
MAQARPHDNLQVRLVYGSRWMDLVSRLRAAHVVHQTQILRHLPKIGLMLDIGSGYGHVGEVIVRDAPARSCVLMEPNYDASPRVIWRTARNARWPLRGDGRHLPFADATFDAAWALFVLHHVAVAEQPVMLDKVRRILRPGGVFVLAEDSPRTLRCTPIPCAPTRRSISSRPARRIIIATLMIGAANC